jgi:hypothetical protein
MDELSKKHGVPKEGVYFLKANFRWLNGVSNI